MVSGLTGNGILYSGITDKQCEYLGCTHRFVPERTSQKYCEDHRVTQGHTQCNARKIKTELHEVEFICVDGEGSGNGKDHKYVLLGCGDQYVTWPNGVTDITEIFSFLYEEFLLNPDAVFCGFFLSYDYNMWLKLLPRERAAILLTEKGKAKRKRKNNGHHLPPFPVEYKGWEFDMLAYKRFKLRPKGAGSKWMYICDTGPFFQQSLLKVIDPAKWAGNPVVSAAEYELLKEGKGKRDHAKLDADMIRYNKLENDVLARVLTRLNEGFVAAGVRLDKRQWFGPGQAAQEWMRIDNKLDHATDSIRAYPTELYNAIRGTYYGGWFEIPCHGIIPGTVHEYDINSAYPHAITKLPCCCGKWKHTGYKPGRKHGTLAACKVSVTGNSPVFGPLPYRCPDGRILRPLETTGWYWQHEIDAARHAGLIKEVCYLDSWTYVPCNHKNPLRGLAGLYDARLRVGKDTPSGKAYKLLYNSVYGKLAQSVGDPRYGNALYASLITSFCRTKILEAIASHPDKAEACVMVATDAVYLTSDHPGLTVSNKLGDWSHEEHQGLTLFKPGVYWDDESRERIANNEDVAFKARGISARAFAGSISKVDAMFKAWDDWPLVWPEVKFQSGFSQVSITQALRWSETKPGMYKAVAGLVSDNKTLTQSADPVTKRDSLSLWKDEHGIWRTKPWRHKMWPESAPYEGQFGYTEESEFGEYATPDGPVLMGFRNALGVGLWQIMSTPSSCVTTVTGAHRQ